MISAFPRASRFSFAVLAAVAFLGAGCLRIAGKHDLPDGVTTGAGGAYSFEAAEAGSVLAIDPAFGISTGYQAPSSRQGVSEARMFMSADELDRRYRRLAGAGARYRQYNVWWSQLESHADAYPSSTQPIACPADSTLVPASESERVALGFHRFRCIDRTLLAGYDELFTRDQANGIQSGIVMWSSPPAYRNPGCQGFDFGGGHLSDGCIPRDSAMDDFEDYVNLLASRYDGGAGGKISAFIVWNENGSADWFDATPLVVRTDVSSTAINARLDRYAEMMKRAHAALARHARRALLLASTDQLWESGQAPGHMGTRVLLEGLWARLGTAYSWSVAVHPYGDVSKPPSGGTYTFNNLEMVTEFQAAHLRARGVADPSGYPQTLLIASEQGWPLSMDHGREGQARQVCLANQKLRQLPQLVAVANNYFHSTEAAETNPDGSSNQGEFFGLIPYSVPNTLEGMEDTSTGQAFLATLDPSLWGHDSGHYCCRVYGLGCPGATSSLAAPSVVDAHPVKGIVDGVVTIDGVPTIRGWACTRGMENSIAVHLYAGAAAANGGQLVGGFTADLASEASVAQACAVSGAHGYRFAIPLDAATLRAYAGQAIYVHGISLISGGANPSLTASGTFRFPSAAATPAPSAGAGTAAHPITGLVDGVAGTSGNATLTGWACAAGVDAPIAVHVYAGGPAGLGQFVTAGVAQLASESPVAQACGVAGAVGHRFAIPLDAAVSAQFGGQPLYVHGISPDGEANLLLTRSGAYRAPAAIPHPITGYLDSAVGNSDGSATIFGWACAHGLEAPIGIHVYAGAAAGTGQIAGGGAADGANEAAVNAACGVAGASGHRFAITLDAATRARFAGSAIYVHGISPTGEGNLTITRSGTIAIP